MLGSYSSHTGIHITLRAYGDYLSPVSAAVEQSEIQLTYENCLLWLRLYELKSGGWVPRALVDYPVCRGQWRARAFRALHQHCSNPEEADSQAFAMGQQWIDERLAGRRQDRVQP
jgi:hypothetical protein